MEPAESLLLAEKSLRQLIRTEIPTKWRLARGAPSESEVLNRRAGEAKSRPGVELSNDDLDYSYIKELLEIYRQSWRSFSIVFPQRIEFETLFKLLANYRNTPSHGRDLLPFERDLVNGAAGYIINHITRYRNERDDHGSYYPVILTVTDEFGNRLTPGGYLPHPNFSATSRLEGPRLSVGDRVRFDCRGSDPKQRDLIWCLFTPGIDISVARKLDETRGSSAVLTWTVDSQEVSEDCQIFVTVTTDSEFKRYHHSMYRLPLHDDERSIYYPIRPPIGD